MVTAGSQKNFGRRPCTRMNILAARVRRNKRSMSVNYEVREILNIGHQELGVTGVPGVTAGSQKNFGRRLCSRIDILAASVRRNKRSMSVNYEVREILNIGHKELGVKRFQKSRQVRRKILEDNYVSGGRPLQQCKEKQKKYNSQPRST